MMTLVTEQSDDRSITEPDPIERRRGLRIAQNRPVKVFDPSSARYLPGQTEDVSVTGLRIELPISAPVQPGKTINIHVGLSSAGQSLVNRRQMIPARIVWINRAARWDRGTMTAGLEFLTGITAHRDAA
jgi:hypothetical protein